MYNMFYSNVFLTNKLKLKICIHIRGVAKRQSGEGVELNCDNIYVVSSSPVQHR